MVVPSDGYQSTFEEDGLAAYRELLALPVAVDRLPFPEPTEEAFLAGGYRVAEECDRLLAVWDGEAAKGLGGTADVVAHARRLGRPVTVVWPVGVKRA